MRKFFCCLFVVVVLLFCFLPERNLFRIFREYVNCHYESVLIWVKAKWQDSIFAYLTGLYKMITYLIFKIEQVEHFPRLKRIFFKKDKSHKNCNAIAFFRLSQPQMQELQILPAWIWKPLSLSCSCFPISTHTSRFLPPLFPDFCCVVSDYDILSSFFSFLGIGPGPYLNLLPKQPHVEKFPLSHNFASPCCVEQKKMLPCPLEFINISLLIFIISSFGALSQVSGSRVKSRNKLRSTSPTLLRIMTLTL